MPTNREILFILKAQNAAAGALAQFGSQLRAAAQQTQQAAAAMNAANAASNRLATGAASAGAAMSRVAGSGTLASTLKNLRSQVLGLGEAFAALKAVELAGEFERSMSTFQAVTGAIPATMDKVRQAALDMGVETGHSATQAADGLIQMARAGFEGQQAIDATRASLSFSIISMTDLGTASSAVSSILRQFHVDAENATKVVDILATVDNKAGASAANVGEAFKYAGTLLYSAGVNVNTLAAAFGVLARNGVQGSMAGTEMQEIVAAMVKPRPWPGRRWPSSA